MRSFFYGILCACGIGYVFGVVFATRAITMSRLQSALGDMILLCGWVGLTFAVLFVPVALVTMGVVSIFRSMYPDRLSREVRIWLLSWVVLGGAIGVPFLGYYYSSGIEPAQVPGADSPWDLVIPWLVRVGRWIGFSTLTAAVCAFAATKMMVRFLGMRAPDERPPWSGRLVIGVPVVILVAWLGPPLWMYLSQGRGVETAHASAPTEPVSVTPEAALAPVLIVGWDGATWDVIDPLLARGELPNLASLISGGVRAPLRTYKPTLSPLLWTTISTGHPPHAHNILSQVENRFAGMDRWFYFTHSMGFDRVFGPIWERTGILDRVQVTSLTRDSRAFWEILHTSGRSVGLVNWRVAWPAEPIAPFNITDHLYLELDRLLGSGQRLSDGELREQLEGTMWPDVNPELLRTCLQSGQERVQRHAQASGLPVELAPAGEVFTLELALSLLDAGFPDVLGVYFYEIDAIEHKFWKYRDPVYFFDVAERDVAEKKGRIDEIYRFTDLLTGDLLARAPEDAIVIILSDHGHGPVFGEFRRSGSHGNAPPGILVMSGPGVLSGGAVHNPSVYDIFPTLMYLSGFPVERGARGRPLVEAFEPEVTRARPVQEIESYGPRPEVEKTGGRTSPVSREMLERLRNLGYIG